MFEETIKRLDSVISKYENAHTNFGEVNISCMAEDCKSAILHLNKKLSNAIKYIPHNCDFCRSKNPSYGDPSLTGCSKCSNYSMWEWNQM